MARSREESRLPAGDPDRHPKAPLGLSGVPADMLEHRSEKQERRPLAGAELGVAGARNRARGDDHGRAETPSAAGLRGVERVPDSDSGQIGSGPRHASHASTRPSGVWSSPTGSPFPQNPHCWGHLSSSVAMIIPRANSDTGVTHNQDSESQLKKSGLYARFWRLRLRLLLRPADVDGGRRDEAKRFRSIHREEDLQRRSEHPTERGARLISEFLEHRSLFVGDRDLELRPMPDRFSCRANHSGENLRADRKRQGGVALGGLVWPGVPNSKRVGSVAG